MAEKRDSGAMRRVSGWDAIEQLGDYYFGERPGGARLLIVLLPGNSFHGQSEGVAFAVLPISHGSPLNQPETTWGWDGSEDAPTLTPSVWLHNHWHGFIRAGRFESC